MVVVVTVRRLGSGVDCSNVEKILVFAFDFSLRKYLCGRLLVHFAVCLHTEPFGAPNQPPAFASPDYTVF